MLSSVRLKNIATISDTMLELSEGLNVLTGETGAGKSILIDGLLLALGERADRNLVRHGAKVASVEAVFILENGDELIIRREVLAAGRSRLLVDDQITSLEDLGSITSRLVDLHSQRTTPQLLTRKIQQRYLDEYSGSLLLADEFAGLFFRYCELDRREKEISGELQTGWSQKEIFFHESEEIDEVSPTVEEYQRLKDERNHYGHAGEQAEMLESMLFVISESEQSLINRITDLKSPLTRAKGNHDELLEMLGQVDVSLHEAERLCQKKLAELEHSPWKLEQLDLSLDRYSKLIARYGGGVEQVINYREKLREELKKLDDLEKEHKQLLEDIEFTRAELRRRAIDLTRIRETGSSKLAETVSKEIKLLGMPFGVFSVALNPCASANSRNLGDINVSISGAEKPEFLFCANPGSEAGRLSTIASGGELSRVSLALKLVLSEVNQPSTMIFDEIDSGVGGETAHLLADALERAATKGRQVIVITHLAQIACRARRHLAVEKEQSDSSSTTNVRILEGIDRITEITRILGGGPAAEEHAKALLSPTETL